MRSQNLPWTVLAFGLFAITVSGVFVPKVLELRAADEAPAGNGVSWNEILPSKILQEEVRLVRDRSKASLKERGTYNANYKNLAVDGSVIAALAGIAIESKADVGWKANAPDVRDIGHQMAKSATGIGRDKYENTKVAFEKLEAAFAGTVASDVKKPAPIRLFHETASRDGLMKRIHNAKDWMRVNIDTEAKLKSQSEVVVHEAMMIAALGKVVTTNGYSGSDEADYQKFANTLITSAREAAVAARDQDFQKFTVSTKKMTTACDQCHANYANN